MRKTIQDVKVGDSINTQDKGLGIVSLKTKRSITVVFNKVTTKLTYKTNDAYFYESDFN